MTAAAEPELLHHHQGHDPLCSFVTVIPDVARILQHDLFTRMSWVDGRLRTGIGTTVIEANVELFSSWSEDNHVHLGATGPVPFRLGQWKPA